MKVLIIEDEARAASHLERLLAKVAPEMEVVARLESVRDALAFLSGKPELGLVFSDIQLADGLSFEIYQQVKVNCPIIFTTAWDHYAIEAFNTNGIDYLLKPIEENRLLKAIEKVRQFSPGPLLEKILAMSATKPAHSHKSRFLVKVGDKIKSIPIEEITAFYSLEKATYLFTHEKRSYDIDFALDHLETLLDPERFFRINRKFMVGLEACANITAWSNSRLKLRIDGLENQEIIVARERVQEFKAWLDG
ncbi:MAG: LytTR family DNA-binding domain-containing protein [Lentimicrobiaceae bacterium]|nr:LytTR family DNA-binding domain-containing protein [Lentimicrobiaceae bacterium]MDD4599027.1 LytTR family DNA-binding domain-containing protein [Lentimicrobiaceae bacterium]